ncbi:MAG: hypothetical protein FWE30_00570 [Bacteroidales bacterium]|nr:hypothetical protein [Bacteroidales bacterium]
MNKIIFILSILSFIANSCAQKPNKQANTENNIDDAATLNVVAIKYFKKNPRISGLTAQFDTTTCVVTVMVKEITMNNEREIYEKTNQAAKGFRAWFILQSYS